MSSQKGNTSRSRPQKYQNHTTFKNDLHDKTHKRKFINSIEVTDVCERCQKIIEWKIKYKKYKPLKAPAKCTKCAQKAVKNAYHIMCLPCAKQNEICPKCTQKTDEIQNRSNQAENVKSDVNLQRLLKSLPERKRRTVIRHINKNTENPERGGIHLENVTDNEKTSTNLQSSDESGQHINSTKINVLLKKFQPLLLKEVEDFDDSDLSDDSLLDEAL